MSDLDQRLARWKAQTEPLRAPPALRAQLKATASLAPAAKVGLGVAVKAAVLGAFVVAIALGVFFRPSSGAVDEAVPKAAAPVPTSVRTVPDSAALVSPFAPAPVEAAPAVPSSVGAAPVSAEPASPGMRAPVEAVGAKPGVAPAEVKPAGARPLRKPVKGSAAP